MGRLVAIAIVLGACGTGDPLEGKSWRPTLALGDQLTTPVFDTQDRLVLHGVRRNHSFRLDRATLLWDDLGEVDPGVLGSLRRDFAGNIYLSQYVDQGAATHPIYRLDDHAWTKLGDTRELSIGAADVGWSIELGGPEARTTIRQRPLGDWDESHWVTTGVFDRALAMGPDQRGHMITWDRDSYSAGVLTAAGDAVQPLYTCDGTIRLPYCQGSLQFPEIDDAGNLTFLSYDASGSAVIYRVAAGTTHPEVMLEMPPLDVDAPHVFNFDLDLAGNAYLVYGANSLSAPSFYFLPAGETSWIEEPRMPDAGVNLAISPMGVVYGIGGSIPSYVFD